MLPESIKSIICSEVEKMEGWTVKERCCEMAELVIDTAPNLVVELGVFGGRTMMSQALALKHQGFGHIYGVDPWKLEPCLEGNNDANREWWSKVDLHLMHRLTMEALWRHDLDAHAIVIRACSQHVTQLFQGIDILYLDGNHAEESSVRDVSLYLMRVKPGGYIHMDDCDWPETQKAQAILNKKCDLLKTEENGHYKLFRKRDSEA